MTNAPGAYEFFTQEPEPFFFAAFYQAPIGMAMVALDGQWLRTNLALCRFLGYTPEEFSALKLQDLAVELDPEKTSELYDQLFNDDVRVYSLEKWFRHKNGHLLWVRLSASLVRSGEGEPLYFIVQIEDISEQAQLRHELSLITHELEKSVEQRTQELFAANEELTAMNEEVLAMNESLEESNRNLAIEIGIRQQKEQEVLLREKQYRATTSLLTLPDENVNDLLKSILEDAIHLLGAPGGSIGLQKMNSKEFIIHHSVGVNPEKFAPIRLVDQGMLGDVFRSGELLCVENYQTYPNRLKNPLFDRVTTVIMMPLKLGSGVKGVLAANWLDETHVVKTDDQEILRQYGILASIVLERVHAKQQISYQNQLLKKLAETTATLVDELNLEKALKNILNQAAAFMNIPHGFIQLFDLDNAAAIIQCGLGQYEKQSGHTIPIRQGGIVAEVFKTGKMVIVEDYALWPNRLTGSVYSNITSAMQAPLVLDGKTIGSIGLSTFDEPFSIDPTKQMVFEQFATIATIAVKNAIAHTNTNRLAFHDSLTGLPNRAFLNQRLELEMQKAQNGETSGAVLFIDLDDLKSVNDSFGHSCGDGVITAAARQILDTVSADSFVARVGGDEFIVILPGEADRERIIQIANNLVNASHREYTVGERNIHMSASVGITLYPCDGAIAEEILKNADNAMYAAKAAGRNCWRFYEPEMLKDAYEKLSLTNSLRHAMERNELFLQFQPQISLKSNTVIGFEALLRWNSPEYGMVSPARFIPLAEQSGLIFSIGQWVILHACRFAKKLSDAGRGDVHVAVNVSPRQLAANDFVEIVQSSILDAGIIPHQLEVEITENVLIDSVEDSIRKLDKLSDLNVSLSLDDFGTGYSSLTYLQSLPVRTLKIDKMFIDRITQDKKQENFVRSIIDMAHALELKVTAEGVETKNQLDKLNQFGCDIVQGYVYSRPALESDALLYIISE